MAWLRLTLEVTADQVEVVTEFLELFSATAISYQPVSGESLFADLNGKSTLWKKTSVTALVDSDTDMDILLVCLRNRLGTENIFNQKIDLLEDRDWTESYRNSITPLVFANRLHVCPSWLRPDPGWEHTLVLDPGLAFGSGSHPTTRLCLEWLSSNNVMNKTVIDYGCGSGILALAAARFGAQHIYAVDIDPQALYAARSNIENNGLGARISIQTPDTLPLPSVDILIANILMKPLMELAEMFQALVKPGGRIALSGILATQATECLAAYGRWFKMDETLYHDEWALLNGRR